MVGRILHFGQPYHLSVKLSQLVITNKDTSRYQITAKAPVDYQRYAFSKNASRYQITAPWAEE